MKKTWLVRWNEKREQFHSIFKRIKINWPIWVIQQIFKALKFSIFHFFYFHRNCPTDLFDSIRDRNNKIESRVMQNTPRALYYVANRAQIYITWEKRVAWLTRSWKKSRNRTNAIDFVNLFLENLKLLVFYYLLKWKSFPEVPAPFNEWPQNRCHQCMIVFYRSILITFVCGKNRFPTKKFL